MKKNRFVTWLKHVVLPDIRAKAKKLFWKLLSKQVVAAIAEDTRKIGVAIIGVGVVGIVVDSLSVPRADALIVFISGVIIWALGLLATSSEPKAKE